MENEKIIRTEDAVASAASVYALMRINAFNFFKSFQNINFIPIYINQKNNKKPVLPWKKYQSQKQTIEERREFIKKYFLKDLNEKNVLENYGVAVITGKINEIETIDIDNKNGKQNEADKYLSKVLKLFLNFNLQPYIERTPRGGYHIIYKIKTPAKSQKLFSTDDIGIETKGEGGYVITTPTKNYVPLQINLYDNLYLTELTEEQRDFIFNEIKKFNEENNLTVTQDNGGFDRAASLKNLKFNNYKTENSVYDFDNFNSSDEVLDYCINLIVSLGWKKYSEDDEYIDFTRPGKTERSVSGGFNKKQKFFYVFTTNAPPLESNTGYNLFTLISMLEYNGDTQKAARELYRKGLLKKKNKNEIEHFAALIKKRKEGLNDEKQKKIYDDLEKNELFNVFYLKNKRLRIDYLKFKNYFKKQGYFAKIYPSSDGNKSYYLVKIQNNICEKITDVDIKKFISAEIEKLPEDFNIENINKTEIANYLIDKVDYKKFLDFLEVDERDFIKDDKETVYLFFKNCVLKITSNQIEKVEYKNINGLIWKNKIINRDFYLIENDDEFNEAFNGFYFADFIFKVFNNKEPIPEINIFNFINEYKKAIGYLIHNYKDPANAKAIFFFDDINEKNFNSEAQGRTGKTLLAKEVLKHYRNVCLEDGRNLNFNDNRFVFQNIDIDTDIVIIDDIRKRFDISNLFSVITSGITIEKKRKQPLKLDYKDSPKILLTANYMIKINDESSRARIFELPFSNYFNSKRTPEVLYNKLLFEDFDSGDWNLFDNFIARCCQYHLKTSFSFINENRQKNYLSDILKSGLEKKFINFSLAYLLKIVFEKEKEIDPETNILKTEVYLKNVTKSYNECYNDDKRCESMTRLFTKILDVLDFSYEKKRDSLGTFFKININVKTLKTFENIDSVYEMLDEIQIFNPFDFIKNKINPKLEF